MELASQGGRTCGQRPVGLGRKVQGRRMYNAGAGKSAAPTVGAWGKGGEACVLKRARAEPSPRTAPQGPLPLHRQAQRTDPAGCPAAHADRLLLHQKPICLAA